MFWPFNSPYIVIKSEAEFWLRAAENAPWTYRWFGRTLERSMLAELDASIEVRPSDLIWPFEFNHNTLAYRKGYVVVRNGVGVNGVITELS